MPDLFPFASVLDPLRDRDKVVGCVVTVLAAAEPKA